jgi:hypothetical protein
MSDLIFPSTLNGFTWDSKKKPLFNNITHSPQTGRDIHISLYDQPIYEFNLANQWLTKADKDALIGFFTARRGSFESFLYVDEDCALQNHVFAVSNGSTRDFQLGRLQNGLFLEKVNNYAPSPLIYLNGGLLTVGRDYLINGTGLLHFSDSVDPTTGAVSYSVPSGGVLSWTGTAYYRCVFLEDSLEYNQFAERLYDCGEIKFKGSLANKV